MTAVTWRLEARGLSLVTGTAFAERGVRPRVAVMRAIQGELAVKYLAINRIARVRCACGTERNRYVVSLGYGRDRRSLLLTTLVRRDAN